VAVTNKYACRKSLQRSMRFSQESGDLEIRGRQTNNN
jgi:hypothetical protein